MHVHTVTGIQPTVFWSLGTEETYDGGKRQASWLGREREQLGKTKETSECKRQIEMGS